MSPSGVTRTDTLGDALLSLHGSTQFWIANGSRHISEVCWTICKMCIHLRSQNTKNCSNAVCLCVCKEARLANIITADYIHFVCVRGFLVIDFCHVNMNVIAPKIDDVQVCSKAQNWVFSKTAVVFSIKFHYVIETISWNKSVQAVAAEKWQWTH